MDENRTDACTGHMIPVPVRIASFAFDYGVDGCVTYLLHLRLLVKLSFGKVDLLNICLLLQKS